MKYDAELQFAEKLAQSYYLSVNYYKKSQSEIHYPDKGLRKMINPATNYLEGLRNLPIRLRDNTIYRIADSFHCIYLFFLLPDAEEMTLAWIGPYHIQEITQKEILALIQALSLSPAKIAQLQKYYEDLPLIRNEGNLLNIFIVLGFYMWGSLDNFSIENISLPLSDELDSLHYEGNNDPQEALLSMRLLEERYATETKLIQAVSQGQTHKAEMMLNNFTRLQMEQRTTDILRNRKNYTVILNTLLRKAAEAGAVHPLHIDSLSSRFAKKIEAAVSIASIDGLCKEMVHKYCLLVKNHSMKGYSLLVRKVLTMIDADLTADLSLRAQAELLNVNSSYLSTLFKKETGATLTEYVNKKRVEHAIFLLNTTNLQIQSIAQHCGIPDVNYFTKTFKKYIGKTPKEYRDLITPYK